MNRGMRVLQTLALPLGYVTEKHSECDNFEQFHWGFATILYYILLEMSTNPHLTSGKKLFGNEA